VHANNSSQESMWPDDETQKSFCCLAHEAQQEEFKTIGPSRGRYLTQQLIICAKLYNLWDIAIMGLASTVVCGAAVESVLAQQSD
jgi:hypothetical protein